MAKQKQAKEKNKETVEKKTGIKHLIIALCFSLVVAFTLFIYEPIVMYSGNINEFWFDFGTLVSAMLLPFCATLTALAVIYAVIFLVTRKKPVIFYVIEVLSFAGYIYFYIHGNFLSGMLPTLYGDAINWWGESMIGGHIASAVLLVALIVLAIIGVKKLSSEKTATYAACTVGAFVIMMLVSFTTTLMTPGIFVDKEVQPVATTKNLNKVSTNKNFYILLVDCTDSGKFNEFVKERYQEDFQDFTYFKDAASGYSSTRNSIPLIFSGKFYTNQMEFNKFSTEALDGSKTFEKLAKEGYNMNFYNDDFTWNSKKTTAFSNLSSDLSNYSQKGFLKQTAKYILYKYLPFALKSYSRIDSLDFASTIKTDDVEDLYKWYNMFYYDNVLTKEPELTNEKLFQYVHIQGAHSPYDMDEDLNPITDDKGTYEQKIGAAAKLASLAIQRLKKAGVYDNSTIVIMADHGWHTHVPVLYIKTAGEKRDTMNVSEKQVSWADLDEAFTRLVDDVTPEDAFADIPTEGRTRYFYVDFEKIPMIENVNHGGKSYSGDAWEKTDTEYDLYRG